VTKSIGDAQSKVEARNFDIRKHLLEYDDVMNEQRKTVYRLRQQLLLGRYTPEILDDDGKPTGKMREIAARPEIADAIKEAVRDMILHYGIEPAAAGEGPKARPESFDAIKEVRNLEALQQDVYQFWGYKFDFKDTDGKEPKKLHDRLMSELIVSLTEQRERLLDLVDSVISGMVEESCPHNVPPEDWKWSEMREGFRDFFGVKTPEEMDSLSDPGDVAHALYKTAEETLLAKEKEMGLELLLRVFRIVYLNEIDRAWVEHLTNMEHLRDGIGLVGYGQRDPKQEYKKEGYDIFLNMMLSSSSSVVSQVFRTQVQRETEIDELERAELERHRAALESAQMLHGTIVDGAGADGEDLGSLPPPRRSKPPQARVVQPRAAPKVARNDACPCGSGLKFKQCHGAALEPEGGSDDANA
jgi:preprotein translocase subunit SecA